MPSADAFLDKIDEARVRRVKELSEIKYKLSSHPAPDPSGVMSKAAVVLTYANWEGFYNECVDIYFRFLLSCGRKVRDVDWTMLVGILTPSFDSLRDRSHSLDARHRFIAELPMLLDSGFESFDLSTIQARSNLDFKRLSQNYAVMSFDLSSMQKFRIRLDKELVGWRHLVAHGDQPDLTALDIADHVNYTATLLAELAGGFQSGMVERAIT